MARQIRITTVLAVLALVLTGLTGLTVLTSPGALATTPPDTTIDSGPEDGALVLPGPVQYTFSSPDTVTGFECSVDNAPFTVCSSPVTYDLGFGGHVFRVRAVDTNIPTVDPTPAHRIWTVRNLACEQASDAYQVAQAHYFLEQGKLGKAKVRLHRAVRHGSAAQVRRARHRLAKARRHVTKAQTELDAAVAQENAVC